MISQTIQYFDAKKELKRSPLELTLEEARQASTLLSFPGKIHADPKANRLFITDSNHNRILVTDPEGMILDSIGSGKAGKKDGGFNEAEFDHPQGAFAEGDFLYIADTENHLIRRADLVKREAVTLFADLNSPWDLLVYEGTLYIAMAGPHQIYSANLKTLEAKPHAGSGREARLDGPLLSAALAQPSGITTDGKKLYFADSEVSSIRSADINPSGKVETIIGEDLFEFGDVDGPSRSARLQHPLGVVYSNGMLYIADTYNSKIKKVDPGKLTSQTYAGTGKHGLKDGALNEAQFFEPGGLAVLGGKIYIADTNNHQIRVIDPVKNEVTSLELQGLEKIHSHTVKQFIGRPMNLPKQKLRQGEAVIRLNVKLPSGYKLNSKAPVRVEPKSEDEKILSFEPKSGEGTVSFPLELKVKTSAGETRVTFENTLYYCAEGSPVCLFEHSRVNLPVEISPDGASVLPVDVEVQSQ